MMAAGAAVALSAGASWATTHEDWDGGFPAGVVRLEVHTADGRPIPGAAFRVSQADGEPIPDYSPFLDPGGPTDARGRLTVVQPHQGIMFGGRRWRLFWVVPMGATGRPRLYCEMAAAGFRPSRVEMNELFATARPTGRATKVTWPARASEVELPEYEATIALEREPPNPSPAPDRAGGK